MTAPKTPTGTGSLSVTTGPIPGSRKTHIKGERHPDLRVAMREIPLHPSA
ncbi:MAG: hypothetical protein OQJ99_10955, partial [Rhodospirillales bacterium]|nr:hypothetical protein [Rhodospirillales bacterium]